MKQIILSRSTLLLTAASLVAVATGDEYTHQYKKGDRVDLWVNKVRYYFLGGSVLKKNDKRFDDYYLICARLSIHCRRCKYVIISHSLLTALILLYYSIVEPI